MPTLCGQADLVDIAPSVSAMNQSAISDASAPVSVFVAMAERHAGREIRRRERWPGMANGADDS